MAVQTTPHVNFEGNARDAIGFYASVFDGEPVIVTYGQFGAAQDPAQAEHVMWSQVESKSGFRIMAYDVQTSKAYDRGKNAFYVALRGDDADEIQRYWDKLAEGANVLTPLAPAPFSPLYGMLTDRFGVTWIVDVMAR